MNFFGMGTWEIMIILVAALVIFGPDRLPEMAGKIGKQIRDLRQMSSDLTGEFERTAGVQELKRSIQGEVSGMKSQVNSVTDSVKRDLDKAGSKVSSSVSSTKSTTKTGSTASSVTAAKTTTASTAKTTSKTSTAKTEPPKASKKDPLADLGFYEEIAPASSVAAKPVVAAKPAASTVKKTNGASTAVSASDPSAQVDALSRARQRRQAAGYNRRQV